MSYDRHTVDYYSRLLPRATAIDVPGTHLIQPEGRDGAVIVTARKVRKHLPLVRVGEGPQRANNNALDSAKFLVEQDRDRALRKGCPEGCPPHMCKNPDHYAPWRPKTVGRAKAEWL